MQNDKLLIASPIEGNSEDKGLILDATTKPTAEQIANEKGVKLRYIAKLHEASELRKDIAALNEKFNSLNIDKTRIELELDNIKNNKKWNIFLLIISQTIGAIGINFYTGDQGKHDTGIWLICIGLLINIFALLRIRNS